MTTFKTFLITVLCSFLTSLTISSTTPKKDTVPTKNTTKKSTTAQETARKASTPQAEASHFFHLGQEQAKKVIDILTSDTTTPDKELIAFNQSQVNKDLALVFKSFLSSAPHLDEYKKNFGYAKEYMRGYHSMLSNFQAVESEDHTVQHKNFLAKQQLIFSDCFIKASDHIAWKKNLDEAMESMQEETEYFSTIEPQEDDKHPAFYIGFEIGQRAGQFIADKAQGIEVTHEMKNEYKELVSKFFKRVESEEPNDRKIAIQNYFLGMGAALSSLPIDEILKDVPQEKAEQLKKQYAQNLRNVEEGYRTAANKR